MLEGIERKSDKKYNWVSFKLEPEIVEIVENLANSEKTTKSEIYRYSVKQLLKKLELIEDKGD